MAPDDRLVGPGLFTGLDVRKDSIAVSLAPSDATEVRPNGVIGGTQDDVLQVIKNIQAAHPGLLEKLIFGVGVGHELPALIHG